MNYELMIAAVNERADQLLGRVEKFIKEANGLNVKIDRLGKKQLAYAIKKQTDATYFLLNFEAEAEAIKPVWDKLRLEQEDLLRYLLLKKENKKPRKGKRSSFAKASDDKKVSSSFAKASGDEDGEKKKPTVTVAVKKAAKATKVTKKETKISKGKSSVRTKKGKK